MINRRTFLTTATQGTIGALALSGFDWSKAMAATKLTKIGVQLYTVRTEMGKDFEGTLKRVAEIGYNQVEFAGYYNHSPKDVKAILDRYSLTAPSVHVPLADIQTKLDTAIEAAKVIGHKLIVCPFLMPDDRKTMDQYKQHAATFNKAAETCKKAGLEFAYHNHNFEFENLDGQMPMDVLLAEADKNLVKIELDLYWITVAKQDPLVYINKHPGRFVAFHVKDLDKNKDFFTEVGRGRIDFKKIFAQSKKAGVKYYFVEQDQCPGSPFDSIKISVDYLKQLEF